MALFGVTARQWREQNPAAAGNMRDHANVHQLVCLANLESMNAYLIQQNIPATQRLLQLNQLAIKQMTILSKQLTSVTE